VYDDDETKIRSRSVAFQGISNGGVGVAVGIAPDGSGVGVGAGVFVAVGATVGTPVGVGVGVAVGAQSWAAILTASAPLTIDADEIFPASAAVTVPVFTTALRNKIM
jgi:hypothetical protein